MGTIELLELIERAFSGVRKDPEQSLHQAQLSEQGIAREITAEEWKACGLLDTDHEWHEVPATDLQDCPNALSFLTPTGWRYYLPAYMRATLEFLTTPLWKIDLPHALLHSLTYDDSYPGLGWFYLARYENLNAAQFDAVRKFLQFVRDNSGGHNFYARDATRALQAYWDLPEGERPTKSLDLKK